MKIDDPFSQMERPYLAHRMCFHDAEDQHENFDANPISRELLCFECWPN
jgi:hypothetical protein